MKLRYGLSLSVAAIFCGVATHAAAANRPAATPVPGDGKTHALVNYAKLPLSFEENRGQAEAPVKFLSRGIDYSIQLTPSQVVLQLQSGRPVPRLSTIGMRFQGANPSPAIGASERQSAVSSYFVGNDPAKWVAGAPNYGRVHYQGLYPGVDLAFYGNHGRLEYDFVVAPGANPKAIRMQFDGVDNLRLDHGDLVLSTAAGEIRQLKPIVYQEAAGARQILEGRYVIQPHHRVTFEIARYDKRRTLIIDPTLTYGTYLGSPGEEVFSLSGAASNATYPAVAADAQGNVYVTGYNGSTAASFTGKPVTLLGNASGGGVDVFVVKMNPTGTALLYSVVFGGGLTDIGGGIAVDISGNAYITGYTNSVNFPVTAGAAQVTLNGGTNAFITKVNAAGTALVYSTFLGGSGNFWGRAIAVDRSGNAYVTGTAAYSVGIPFPLVSPLSSAPSSGFLTEVNAAGTAFAYSTYLAAGIGYGVAVDSSADAYVTGSSGTASAPSPAQGYVLKVNAGGTGIAYGPVLLGNSSAALLTAGFGIAVDEQNNAYVTGMTNDPSFPQISGGAPQSTFGGGLTDAFAIKLDPAGTLVYGTYIGGLGSSFLPERGSGIGVDTLGNVYVSGTTQCIGFPSANPIAGARNGGPAVLMSGTLNGTTSTWTPTTLAGSFDQVTALAFDPSGNLYAGASAFNAAGGGIYKQTFGSGAWTPATSGITATTIDSIAVDPNTPSIVYAAGGGHLYQTTNGGGSWTLLSQGASSPAVIAVAKTSPSSTVYLGSSAGIMYSTNGGASWNLPSTPPPAGVAVKAIAVDPNNARTAYAGTSSSVYQTVDGGTTWTLVNAGLPSGPGGVVTSMAVYSASNPSVVYAATPNGLYYSLNSGGAWNQVQFAPEVNSTPLLVAVDTNDNVYVAFLGGGLTIGTNGGTQQSNWGAVNYNGLTQNQIEALATPSAGAGQAYAGIVAATDAFMTELSPSWAILSSTCIGGSDNNLGQSIAVTPGGAVFVSGLTTATNFPATPGAVQTANAGLYDAFVARVDNVPFGDVAPTNPYFNFINVMYETGITGGCASNPLEYCPNSSTTRGEMAVFIITAMFGGKSFSYTTTPYFTDVPSSNIFFKFIQKMKDLGITSGCGANVFCPNDSVTRGEMAAFIIAARYGNIPFSYPSTPYFGDVPSSNIFFRFVQKMAQMGITSGCGNGNFCPDSSLTRGQMAVFIVTGLLDELLPPTVQLIADAVPNSGTAGQILTVTISGAGTNFGAGTQVAVPTGMTVSNLQILSPTSLTVQLTISTGATSSLTATNGGPYTIAVTTGTAEADLPNGFIVQ